MKGFLIFAIFATCAWLTYFGYFGLGWVAWAAEEDHAHKSPHGGQVKTMGSYHVEFLVEKDGKIRVYLLDKNTKPLSAEGVEGVAYLRPASGGGEGGMKTLQLKLSVDKSYLGGAVNLKELSSFEAGVRLIVKGQKFAPVKFNYPLKKSNKEGKEHTH